MVSRNFVHPENSQAGQAGLIVVLLSVVVLTIGLSLMVRTTQQAQIAAQQEESAKIFGAAESGVEKALADIQSLEQDQIELSEVANQSITGSNANVNLQISQDNILRTHLDQGSAAELAVNTTDDIEVNWSLVGCSQNPAALIISIYNNTASTFTTRFETAGTITTRFEAVKGQGCTSGTNFAETTEFPTDPYNFRYDLPLQAGDYFVRIEPIFSGTDIMAAGPAIDRAQFTVVAKAEDVTGNNQAKAIEVKRTLSTPPSFMDYTLYSGSSITK